MDGVNETKISKRIRMICLDKGIQKKDLADTLGIKSTQSFYNALSRDSMSYKYVANILNALNCEIVIRDTETGKEY